MQPTPLIPVRADDHLGAGASSVLAHGVSLALFGAIVVALLCWRRYARDARRARSAVDPDSELGEGPAIVVGEVQRVASSSVAVKVEIEQEATEKENSGSWSHKWTEVDRRVRVAPFYLQRPQGERIRIHPTEKVFLVDDMDKWIHFDHLRRRRIVELVPGETVIARGVLRRDLDPEGQPHGYRDAPIGWILDPPHHQPMHLSSEPLEARFVRWRRFHLSAAALLLAVLVATQLTLLGYYKRVLGETSSARVFSMYHYTTEDDDGDDIDHWEVTSTTSWGAQFTAEVDHDSWLRITEGSRVPIRHFNHAAVQYGSQPTLHLIAAIILLCLAAAAVIAYAVWTRRAKPWYAAKVVDRGDGHIDAQTGLDDPK